MNWGDLAVQLNDAGYFTRHCSFDGRDAIEIAHPGKDVFTSNIASLLRRQDISLVQVANLHFWFVRLQEKK